MSQKQKLTARSVLGVLALLSVGAAVYTGKLNTSVAYNMVMGVFWFIVVMSVLVIIHEFAHFVVGKKLGAEPEVFSVGMGKVLYKFNWLGAEFRISALPIGGYVKFKKVQFDGENGEDGVNEKIKPSAWIWIALAGPVSNLVVSFVVFATMSFIALDNLKIVHWGSNVYNLQMDCAKNSQVCPGVAGLAQRMFLRQKGVESTVFDLNNYAIVSNPEVLAQSAQNDVVSDNKVATSVVMSYHLHKFFVKMTFNSLIGLFTNLTKNYTHMSGPIGIANQLHITAKMGVEYLWMMFGAISFSLGFMNLLPLSVLDGGRVLLAIYQTTVKANINIKFLNVVNGVSVLGLLILMLIGVFADLGRLL